jgi:hypothetical protein
MPNLPDKPARADIDAFLRQVGSLATVRPASGRPGRLLFAIDATASRQPTWDRAAGLTADMFAAVKQVGGLAVSLAYFRGHQEFAATPFLTDAVEVTRRMGGVVCAAGQTQIGRVLRHALAEHRKERVAALVLIGDAVEEDIDGLAGIAGEMGLSDLRGFFFHEGGDPIAGNAFRTLARLSGGAYAPFDLAAAGMLRKLLEAVAVYAAGGRQALLASARSNPEAARIAGQLPAPAAGRRGR